MPLESHVSYTRCVPADSKQDTLIFLDISYGRDPSLMCSQCLKNCNTQSFVEKCDSPTPRPAIGTSGEVTTRASLLTQLVYTQQHPVLTDHRADLHTVDTNTVFFPSDGKIKSLSFCVCGSADFTLVSSALAGGFHSPESCGYSSEPRSMWKAVPGCQSSPRQGGLDPASTASAGAQPISSSVT